MSNTENKFPWLVGKHPNDPFLIVDNLSDGFILKKSEHVCVNVRRIAKPVLIIYSSRKPSPARRRKMRMYKIFKLKARKTYRHKR